MLESRSVVEMSCACCATFAPQRYLYSKNHCDVVMCSECGLGHVQTREFDPSKYYTSAYFSGGCPDGYADYLGSENVLRREFARTVRFIRRYHPSGTLLEIGCAYGFFLSEAERFFQVSGIEPARDAVAHCRNKGLNVLAGGAEELKLRTLPKADVIVLLDVLEHLPRPDETLASCVHQLNPGGIVVLTTGDFGSTVARWAGRRWRLMTPPQHLWFFSAESLSRLSARLGLTVEWLDHPWKIVPLSLVAFQLKRMLGLRAVPAARAGRLGIPANLFDAMRVVLRRSRDP